jgi:hypothetical protein
VKSIIRKRGTIARSIFVKCVKLGQNKAYDFEIKTKKNFATAYSPRVGEGAGYKKAREGRAEEGKMDENFIMARLRLVLCVIGGTALAGMVFALWLLASHWESLP